MSRCFVRLFTAVALVGAALAGAVPARAAHARSGYWMLGADGAVYAFGGAHHHGNGPAGSVDLEPAPAGDGYWVLNDRGEVFAKGAARHLGGSPAGERAASLSVTPSGAGYWIFTSRGRVFAYGDAPHKGDMAGVALNGPVLDSVATPTGAGYWMVASDGGIFAFEAPFYGSMGATKLNKPVSGMVPGSAGYLMVAEDGGIFAFGDVAFHGSLGNNPPRSPVVAVALLPDGPITPSGDGEGLLAQLRIAAEGPRAGYDPGAAVGRGHAGRADFPLLAPAPSARRPRGHQWSTRR